MHCFPFLHSDALRTRGALALRSRFLCPVRAWPTSPRCALALRPPRRRASPPPALLPIDQ
eukprot:2187086-Pleurochrysis_carterae.AAC.1